LPDRFGQGRSGGARGRACLSHRAAVRPERRPDATAQWASDADHNERAPGPISR
jgi:hypothetical protein